MTEIFIHIIQDWPWMAQTVNEAAAGLHSEYAEAGPRFLKVLVLA